MLFACRSSLTELSFDPEPINHGNVGESTARCAGADSNSTGKSPNGIALLPNEMSFITPVKEKQSKNFDNSRRARTLPPDERTSLLTSQCSATLRRSTTNRKPRRRRPWSLVLHEGNFQINDTEENHFSTGKVSLAHSESAIPEAMSSSNGTHLFRPLKRKGIKLNYTRRPAPTKLYASGDCLISSSEEEPERSENEEDLSSSSSEAFLSSMHTLVTVPSLSSSFSQQGNGKNCNINEKSGRKSIRHGKSQSTSALWRNRNRTKNDEDVAISWDDYQVRCFFH